MDAAGRWVSIQASFASCPSRYQTGSASSSSLSWACACDSAQASSSVAAQHVPLFIIFLHLCSFSSMVGYVCFSDYSALVLLSLLYKLRHMILCGWGPSVRYMRWRPLIKAAKLLVFIKSFLCFMHWRFHSLINHDFCSAHRWAYKFLPTYSFKFSRSFALFRSRSDQVVPANLLTNETKTECSSDKLHFK